MCYTGLPAARNTCRPTRKSLVGDMSTGLSAQQRMADVSKCSGVPPMVLQALYPSFQALKRTASALSAHLGDLLATFGNLKG